MEVGEKIRLLRQSKGWSQGKLAEKMGYTSRSTINKIEAGVNEVSLSTLRKLAAALEVDIRDLVTEDPIIIPRKEEKP